MAGVYMNGFELRRQGKMKDIINAAFELFIKKGLDDVTITEIAKKANVSKVSIYNFFGSKEELARQVIYDFMEQKSQDFFSIFDSDLPFKEKYHKMIAMKMDIVPELSEHFLDNRLLLSPEMQQFLQSYYETKIKPRLIQLIEQGKSEGDIDSSVSTVTILMYIQAISNLLNTPIEMNQRIEMGKLFYYGLRGK
jgi:AcrR family transcriptional regulator